MTALDELLKSFEKDIEPDGEVAYLYYGNVTPADATAELAALRAESESRRVLLEDAKTILEGFAKLGGEGDLQAASEWLERYGKEQK